MKCSQSVPPLKDGEGRGGGLDTAPLLLSPRSTEGTRGWKSGFKEWNNTGNNYPRESIDMRSEGRITFPVRWLPGLGRLAVSGCHRSRDKAKFVFGHVTAEENSPIFYFLGDCCVITIHNFSR